jgi:type III secretory pathway component EscS
VGGTLVLVGPWIGAQVAAFAERIFMLVH